jgi:hypothetical protein
MKRFLIMMGALSLIPSSGWAQPRRGPSGATTHFSYGRASASRFSAGGSRSFSGGFSGASFRPMMGGGRGISGGTGTGRLPGTPTAGGHSATTTTTAPPGTNPNQAPPPWATVGNYVFSPGMIVKTDIKGANEQRITNDAGGIHYDDTSHPVDFNQARGVFTDPVMSGYAGSGSGGSSGTLFGNLGH